MKVLKHGIYYNENKEIECNCGCKYEYEEIDVIIDGLVALTTNPQQYRRYVICPECKAKTYLSNIYASNKENI